MKHCSVHFVSKGCARLVPLEPREMGADQVRLRGLFSLVSTGTELAFLTGKHHDVAQGKRSFPMPALGGYSFVGEIIEIGPRVEGWRLGQRVLAMSGHSSEGIANASSLTPVPENLTDAQASFGIVGSISLHGVRMAGVQLGHGVLVTGQGLIGQLAGQIARLAGASHVLVTDMSQARLNMALKTGATAAHRLDQGPLAEAVKGPLSDLLPNGISAAIESSGQGAALRDCFDVVSDEGTIALLGCPHEPIEIDLYPHLQKRQLKLVGAYQPACPDQPNPHYPWSKQINRKAVFDWIEKGMLDVDSLLNDAVLPENVEGMYKRLIKQDASVAGGINWSRSN